MTIPIFVLEYLAKENPDISEEAKCPFCGGVVYCDVRCKAPREYDNTAREAARLKLHELAKELAKRILDS